MVTMNPRSKGPLRYVADFERKVGGAELNLAIGCARLGLRTGWIGRLGNDEFGKYVYNFARGEGIDVSNVELMDGYATSLNFKEIREDGTGSTYYYRTNSPTLLITADNLPEDAIRSANILHLTGVFSAIRRDDMSVIHRAIEIAKSSGVLVAFDPNIRLKLWSKEDAVQCLLPLLADVDIMLTGQAEAELLLGVSKPEDIIGRLTSLGVQRIAIKREGDGSIGFDNGLTISMPALPPSAVVDTVGAGDGFDAGFLLGVIKGWPLDRTLAFANAVGSMVVSVSGDNEGLPLYDEVQQKLGLHPIIAR